MFDNGLWTIGDDYRVIVARGAFADYAGDEGFKRLLDYEGMRVHLPDEEALWPDRRHLTWHRERRFKGRIEIH
jgi:predicted restriction endonuclease